MDNKDINKFYQLDEIEGDSCTLKIYRLLVSYLSLNSGDIPFDKLIEDAINLLGLDGLGIYLLDEEKKVIKREYFKSRYGIVYKNINPLDYLHFIQEEKKSILIKSEEGQDEYELILVPIQYESDIIGVLIARNSVAANSCECARAVEQLSIQLSWAYHNINLNQSLMEMNAKLVIVKNELEESLKQETIELIDNELKLETMQAQLIQSEKLSSMGKLITGVAHEIKNPMTGIVGYVSLISSLFNKLSLRDNHGNLIEGLEMAVSHLESVITNFLSFARKNDRKFERISVRDVITKTEAIIRNHLKIRKIKFGVRIDEDIPMILGDINQLVQVLMNLIINAEQAIPGDDGTIDIHAYKKDDNLVVEVRDNGIGIKEVNIQKVFDSFFTTKGLENSSGIGLFVSKQIIDDHNAVVAVISKEMLGTKFILTFPGFVETGGHKSFR